MDGQGIRLTRTKEEAREGITEIPEYKDFLVILRYKDSMEVYSKALKEYGIPVQLSGGSSLLDVEELKEFIILLKYLKDPENEVLLVAVLRGMFLVLAIKRWLSISLKEECLEHTQQSRTAYLRIQQSYLEMPSRN